MAAPNYPYRALRDIQINGYLAFKEGDLIPEDHVKNRDLGLGEGTDYAAVPKPKNVKADPKVEAELPKVIEVETPEP